MNVGELIDSFPDLTVSGLSQGSIYALVALGYTLVYGVLRLINFAHSEVFMIGTMAALGAWTLMGLDSSTGRPSVWVAFGAIALALVFAMVASAVIAVLLELIAYRPLRHRNAPPLAFLITAIGASFVLMEVVGTLTVRRPFGVPALLPTEPLFSIGEWVVRPGQLTTLGLALVMMVGLDFYVHRTRAGRGIRAVAQDANTAALMGVNKGRVIILVFLLGGLMAGVAGVFNDIIIGSTKFNVGFLFGLKAFSAAVLGGIGNLRGALVGGLVLGLVENYASALFGSEWRDFVAFVVLIALLMFRPTGLLGESLGRARA